MAKKKAATTAKNQVKKTSKKRRGFSRVEKALVVMLTLTSLTLATVLAVVVIAGPTGAGLGALVFQVDEQEEDVEGVFEAAVSTSQVQLKASEQAKPKTPFEKDFDAVMALAEQAKFTEAIRAAMTMQTTYKDHPRKREVVGFASELRVLRRDSGDALYAAEKLKDEDLDDAEVRAILRVLTRDDLISRSLIHTFIREGTSKHVRTALKAIVDAGDDKAAELIVFRLGKETAEDELIALYRLLPNLIEQMTRENVVAIFKKFQDAKEPIKREIAAFLGTVAGVVAGGEKDSFNELIGEQTAFNDLQGYFKAAMASGDDALISMASRFSQTFALYVSGLRGDYYQGMKFDSLVFSRRDKRINFRGDGFSEQQHKLTENFSVRWTGYLVVPKGGKYRISSTSDDGQRVFINGRRIINDWRMHAAVTQTRRVQLKQGVHAIKIEYMQGGGDKLMELRWDGPGLKREFIGAGALRTDPWIGMK